MISSRSLPRFFALLAFAWSACPLRPAELPPLDLRNAVVVVRSEASDLEKKAGLLLVDEIARRSQITLPTETTWPAAGRTVIALITSPGVATLPPEISRQLIAAPNGPEGYRVQRLGNAIVIAGNQPGGAMFGAGYLLRQLRLASRVIELAGNLAIATSPRHALRGHQIGYRPKVNTYDGWTPQIFEQYVRDLVVFGTNAIELIPPRSDDADQSPHFNLPKIEMMEQWSRIIASYGLQVWIWFPAMDPDYGSAKDVEFALKEWDEVFRRLPRIDAILVPGGDPGHTRPMHLMAMLEKQVKSLRARHPGATLWVSPQGFSGDWMTEFLEILKGEPAWLTGVVMAPQVRLPLPELRAKVPARYPLRLYPDITHSVHGEYAVPEWDLAYAVTMGREIYCPRPIDQWKIFRYALPHTIGTITYSEGVNDDVNKVVWSALGWNPDADLKQILREYAQYFIGHHQAESVAEGLLSLERNWRGPLIGNPGVETTLAQFRTLERNATPTELLNWRFQQMLFRAYFDAYVRTRLIRETMLEQQAMELLRQSESLGSVIAMQQAEARLDEAVTHPVARDLRQRLNELAEALYQSIRSQLTVDRYRALSVSRGASLDTADHPLNSRWWLKARFEQIRTLPGELERLGALADIVDRANPGPGGYYDDLGNLALHPHLLPGRPFAEDPGSYFSPRVNHLAFGGGQIGSRSVDAVRPDGPARHLQYPIAWWSFVEAKLDGTISMEYADLDRGSRYRLKVVYVSRSGREARVRLVANDSIEIHPYLKKEIPFGVHEFDLPPASFSNGRLRLTWSSEPGAAGQGIGPMIAEAFLICNPPDSRLARSNEAAAKPTSPSTAPATTTAP